MSSSPRKILIVLCCTLALALSAPAAFASGCGEICNFNTCETGTEFEEGCIQRPHFCLDMLCYAATPASCATSSADLGELVDVALEGVDLQDHAAVAKALSELPTPVRLKMDGDIVFQSPSFDLEKAKLRLDRTGAGSQLAATETSTDTAQQ